MDDGLKQRIVGALVLLALLVIFLPVLFDRNRVEPVDRTSQIPPAISVPAAPINPPVAPVLVESDMAPPPEQMLVPAESTAEKPEVIAAQNAKIAAHNAKNEAAKTAQSEALAQKKPEALAQKKPEALVQKKSEALVQKNTPPLSPKLTQSEATKPVLDAPKLNPQGAAEAWLLQVGSYKTAAQANKLREELAAKGFNAYTRALNSPKGPVVRVFVGPKLDKTTALEQKKRIDELFKLNVLVLPYTPSN
ncbi:MAG: hypothetical protein RL497_2638 [Pseudomonadota bacterium]|jgi:DedD protein